MLRGGLSAHREQVLAWRKAGATIAEIAARLGCTHQAVSARLLTWGARRKPKPRPSARKLRRLYVEQGLSCSEIAKLLGRYTSTVTGWLKRAGIQARPRRKPIAESLRGRDEEIRRLYVDEWLSTQEIAERFGVARSTVARRLRALGVALRPRGAEGTRPDVLRRLKAGASDRALRGAPKRRRTPCDEELRRQYVDERLSSYEIAERAGCSQSAVLRSLKAAGIERRGEGLSGVRREVLQRVSRAAHDANLQRRLEAEGAQARCPTCGKWVVQAPDVTDPWASAMARLDAHLHLIHGADELQRRRALSTAEWRAGSDSRRRATR